MLLLLAPRLLKPTPLDTCFRGTYVYGRQLLFYRSPVSVSKSTTFSAGLSGISTAGAGAYSNGKDAKTQSHSLSFGQAAATSFGAVENGRAITGAASSVGTSQSSAVSGASQGQSFSQAGAVSVQYPNRPTWNNVAPSYGHNGKYYYRRRISGKKRKGLELKCS